MRKGWMVASGCWFLGGALGVLASGCEIVASWRPEELLMARPVAAERVRRPATGLDGEVEGSAAPVMTEASASLEPGVTRYDAVAAYQTRQQRAPWSYTSYEEGRYQPMAYGTNHWGSASWHGLPVWGSGIIGLHEEPGRLATHLNMHPGISDMPALRWTAPGEGTGGIDGEVRLPALASGGIRLQLLLGEHAVQEWVLPGGSRVALSRRLPIQAGEILTLRVGAGEDPFDDTTLVRLVVTLDARP